MQTQQHKPAAWQSWSMEEIKHAVRQSDPDAFSIPADWARMMESISQQEDRYGDSVLCVAVLRVPQGTTDAQILRICQAFRVPVREQRCRCEHDCCGHWFGDGARIERGRMQGRRFSRDRAQTVIVRTSRGRNV